MTDPTGDNAALSAKACNRGVERPSRCLVRPTALMTTVLYMTNHLISPGHQARQALKKREAATGESRPGGSEYLFIRRPVPPWTGHYFMTFHPSVQVPQHSI